MSLTARFFLPYVNVLTAGEWIWTGLTLLAWFGVGLIGFISLYAQENFFIVKAVDVFE